MNIIKYFCTKNKISRNHVIIKEAISKCNFYFTLVQYCFICTAVYMHQCFCWHSHVLDKMMGCSWCDAPVWMRAGVHEAIWLFNGIILLMSQTAIMITVSVCAVSLWKASQVGCALIDSHWKPNNGLHSPFTVNNIHYIWLFHQNLFFPLFLILKG